MIISPVKSEELFPVPCRELISSFPDIYVPAKDIELDPNGRMFKYQYIPITPPLSTEIISKFSSKVAETKPTWPGDVRRRDAVGQALVSCNVDHKYGKYLASETKRVKQNVPIKPLSKGLGVLGMCTAPVHDAAPSVISYAFKHKYERGLWTMARTFIGHMKR